MGRHCAVNERLKSISSVSGIVHTSDNKIWTEVYGKKWRNTVKNTRSRSTSSETNRKLFCDGDEHDERVEKNDISKDEITQKINLRAEKHPEKLDFNEEKYPEKLNLNKEKQQEKQDLNKEKQQEKQDLNKEKQQEKQDLNKEKQQEKQDLNKEKQQEKQDLNKEKQQEKQDLNKEKQQEKQDLNKEKQDQCKDEDESTEKWDHSESEYQWGFEQFSCEYDRGCSSDQDSDCVQTFSKQIEEDFIPFSRYSADNYTSKGFVVEDSHVSVMSSTATTNNSQEKVCNMVFSDCPDLFNYNIYDSSIDVNKHLTSLIESFVSVCYVCDYDSCSLNATQSMMMDKNITGLTEKETMMQVLEKAKPHFKEHNLKRINLTSHSKHIYNSLLKIVQKSQEDTQLESKICTEVENGKDLQFSEKSLEADVQEKATLEDQEKDEVKGKIYVENNLQLEMNLPACEEDVKTTVCPVKTVEVSETKLSDGIHFKVQTFESYQEHLDAIAELVAAYKEGMTGIQTMYSSLYQLQRELDSVSFLFPLTSVVSVNNANYRVRSCAEKYPSGHNSYSGGQSGPNSGSTGPGQRQNSDGGELSGSGRDGTNGEEKNNGGDRNNNDNTDPTRSMLNVALLPRSDYKAYKKKHSTLPVDSLCDILGALVHCQDETTINETLMENINYCLVILLHTVLQQPSSTDCYTCDILHSLMTHFATMQHPYMSCSLCRQIFLLIRWHIVRCTVIEINERSSSDICYQITRDPEFKANLVEKPERLWYKLVKYLGAVLCSSDIHCSSSVTATADVAGKPDAINTDLVDAKPNTCTTNNGKAIRLQSVSRTSSSTLTSIPEDEDAGATNKHQPLSRRRSQSKLSLQSTTSGSHLKSASGETKTGLLDLLDNALPVLPQPGSDRSPLSSLGSGSASGTGLSAEEFISQYYNPDQDPYTTQTKTYGKEGMMSLPGTIKGLRGGQQMLSLETRPVGEPGIGEVVYGRRDQLLKVARSWTTIKKKMTETGDLHNQRREEGVILALSRNDLKILLTRYQKHVQWQRLVHLGNGLSGTCHLAMDNKTDFRFCVKRIHIMQYEETELEMWSKLEHRNIVKLYGAIRKGRKIYIFSEFIDGGSLTALIDEQRSLNRRISHWLALKYLKQLLQALQYLKEKNIVHEDLKSDNILVKRNSTEIGRNSTEIVLTDFGLTRWFNKDQELVGRSPTGSQPYWSPEKAASMGHGFASDRWAAICILVHMLSGHPPWTRRFENKIWLHYIIFDQSPPMQDVPENIQTAVRSLISLGFTVKAEERPEIETLLAHQAFQILEQGDPDTCYSVLQSSGHKMPNNILQKAQGEGQEIEEILLSFQDSPGRAAAALDEPTNNLSLVRHNDERSKSMSSSSWNIPNHISIVESTKISEQYQTSGIDSTTVKQSPVSSTNMMLPNTLSDLSSHHNEATSRQNEASSKQNEASSKQNEASSHHNESPSKQNESPSKQNEATSKHNEATSKRNEVSSKQNEASSKQNEASSRQNEASSRQNEASSKQNESSSKQNEVSSKHNEVSSKQNEASSKQNEASSKQNEASSRQNEASSRQNEASSKQNESSSKQNETSQQNEASSKQNEASSKQNEASSKQNESSSKQNETSQQNEASSKQNEASSKQNEASSKQNEASSKKKEFSSKTQESAIQEHADLMFTSQASWNDSDCQLSWTGSDDLDSIKQFLHDDDLITFPNVRPSLQPYQPDPSQITKKPLSLVPLIGGNMDEAEKMSSLKQSSDLCNPGGNGISDSSNPVSSDNQTKNPLIRVNPRDSTGSQVTTALGGEQQSCNPLIQINPCDSTGSQVTTAMSGSDPLVPANSRDPVDHQVTTAMSGAQQSCNSADCVDSQVGSASAERRHGTSIQINIDELPSERMIEISSMFSHVKYGDPVLSGDLYGSDPVTQLKDKEQTLPEDTNKPSKTNMSKLVPALTLQTANDHNTTSIDDQLEEDKRIKHITDPLEAQQMPDSDVVKASTNESLYVNVNMIPKHPLHKTLSENVPLPGAQSTHPLCKRSETSPGTLASLASRQQSVSPGLSTSQRSVSIASELLQSFSEANPSTPCSQYDLQQREFNAVFQQLSESGISVEDPNNDRLEQDPPTDDDLLSLHLTSMQQQISDISEDMGVSMRVLSESNELLGTFMVPPVYEDWRSVADMIRQTVHNAGMKHFTVKSQDGSDIDFYARIDKSKMDVIATEIAEGSHHDGCWCEDHRDQFRGMA